MQAVCCLPTYQATRRHYPTIWIHVIHHTSSNKLSEQGHKFCGSSEGAKYFWTPELSHPHVRKDTGTLGLYRDMILSDKSTIAAIPF